MSQHHHNQPERRDEPTPTNGNSKPPFEAIGKVSVWAAKHWAKWLASIVVALVMADNHLTHNSNPNIAPEFAGIRADILRLDRKTDAISEQVKIVTENQIKVMAGQSDMKDDIRDLKSDVRSLFSIPTRPRISGIDPALLPIDQSGAPHQKQ